MLPKDTKWGLTAAQTDILCTFMEENPEVVKGYRKTNEFIDNVRYKWKKITPQLNSLGRSKDPKSWAKYLCNVKAKLKRKNIKWSRNRDGSGPIICNASDFNEIELRMLQVLHKQTKVMQDSQDVSTSYLDMKSEDNVKDDEGSCDVVENSSWQELSEPADTITYIKLPDSDSPILHTRLPTCAHSDSGDEFDTFGKNIAQQLKTLPLALALESQEMLLSVLRKQRLKILSGISNPS